MIWEYLSLIVTQCNSIFLHCEFPTSCLNQELDMKRWFWKIRTFLYFCTGNFPRHFLKSGNFLQILMYVVASMQLAEDKVRSHTLVKATAVPTGDP